MEFNQIDYRAARDFLLPKHYSGRVPSISYAYGAYVNNQLVACLTVGKPASPSLCKGVCGVSWASNVYELNRLLRIEHYQEPLSKFVGMCLKELSKNNIILISYSDTDMHHHGYIYQACNFIYTGMTKKRTDKYTVGNKHSRHYKDTEQTGMRKVRSAKHRYLYFCTKSKKLKKEWLASLNYKIEKYPKGINKNYVLGNFLQPEVV